MLVGVSLVHRVKAELLVNPPGEQKPSAGSSSIVGETNLHPIPGQLVAVGGADDNVTLEPGLGNLAADIPFKPSNRTCLQVAELQEPAKAPGKSCVWLFQEG